MLAYGHGVPAQGPTTVLQLRIDLEEVDPPIWRRLLVPSGIRLDRLHDVFQVAMGWTDSHLHAFTIGEQALRDASSTTSSKTSWTRRSSAPGPSGSERRFRYEYDFGDGWQHQVVVEEVTITTPVGLPSRCAWTGSVVPS